MATAGDEYYECMKSKAAGDIDLLTDVIKAMLLGTSFTVDLENDQFVADIQAAEVDGTGYVSGFAGAGRKTITTPALTVIADGCTYDADNLTWSALQADVGTIKALALYQHNSSDADSRLIAVGVFSPNYVPTGNDLTVQWDASLKIIKWVNN